MGQVVRTLLIEDNQDTLEFITKIIVKELHPLQIVASCDTVVDSKKCIAEYRPDLILMDIRLKDGDAFEILEAFPNPDFEVIFITGHGLYMQRAFENFAFSYLCKPFDKKDLVTIINRYLTKKERLYASFKIRVLQDFISTKGTRFLVHTGSNHEAIDLKNLIYCKADGNYTLFFMDNGKKIMASNALKHHEKLLEPKGFYRINRFYLINVEHIKAIHKKEAIVLTDGSSINLSSRNRERLSELIEKYNTFSLR
ncbi:LytR/AlgR family response regulator transcription factor [Maribacter sp. 2-571]|uniref:LytR/AlgR family response regulator transcription factor n=1 Tax=Maribacter sp. 2-571 TaxID=3417569 RepID=UPI003D343570